MPDDVFKSSVSQEEHRTVVTLEGELDAASSDELTQVLEDVVRNGPRRVVVDLAGVTFMDSSGLRCLLHGADHATSHDTTLVVERASGIVRRVLELTGCDQVLNGNGASEKIREQSVGS
jgi:anti-sigma B factor antagonist